MSALSEKQIEFLKTNSEFIEKLPTIRSLYERALEYGIQTNDSLQLLLLYADQSEKYKLRVVRFQAMLSTEIRVRVTVMDLDRRGDSLGLVEFVVDPSLDKEEIIEEVYRVVKNRYKVDLNKLTNLTKLLEYY